MHDLAFGRLILRGRMAVQASVRARESARRLMAFVQLEQERAPSSSRVVAIHTDTRGVIRTPDEGAARLFNVPVERLVGMQLLHFVARGHTRFVRDMIRALRFAVTIEPASVAFRPRHGAPQLLRTCVASAGPSSYRWTLAT